MYQFHYDYVKVKYPGDRSKLLFTDTDSLVYKIRTQNLYQDMLEDKFVNEEEPEKKKRKLYV